MEGLKPSVILRYRDPLNFGAEPDGLYLKLSKFWMDGGANLGSGYELVLVQYQAGIPTGQNGTGTWNITDWSGKIITSGTVDVVNGRGFVFFNDDPVLNKGTPGKGGGPLAIPSGAYHFNVTLRDLSGNPSTDPKLATRTSFRCRA